MLLGSGSPAAALRRAESALAAHESALGADHAWTGDSGRVAADALEALGRTSEAVALRSRYRLLSAGVR